VVTSVRSGGKTAPPVDGTLISPTEQTKSANQTTQTADRRRAGFGADRPEQNIQVVHSLELDKHATIGGFAESSRISVASILVIDDDHAVLATIEMLLRRHAHNVVVTDDGHKGLDLFRTGTFDLLILDIFMPAMDGLETMKLAHRYRPEVPIIVISGNEPRLVSEAAPNFLRMATKLGAISSIQKPFRPAEFLAVVDNCLSDRDRSRSAAAPAPKKLSTD